MSQNLSAIQNICLLERSKLFERYAMKHPTSVDKVELKLDYPNVGWIDMHFIVNGEEKKLITASDVYEPFEDIREWLEFIVKHVFDYSPSGVRIYDESYDYFLYYEPIVYQTDELMTSHAPDMNGLFYIFDGEKKTIVAEAFVSTKQFVRSIYLSILNYAVETKANPQFVEDWIVPAYNRDYAKYEDSDPRINDIFLNKVKSEIIERFCANEYSTKRFIQVK